MRRLVVWSLAGAASAAAAGCASSVGHRGVAAGSVVAAVDLFYATDRAASGAAGGAGEVDFGWRRDGADPENPCTLGVCRVEFSRPRNHDREGSLPKSRRELVSVVSTTALEHEAFYRRLREKIWYGGAGETFVFVHGFNNDFEDAAVRTAEIWYDVGFAGPPILFSWPSRGGKFWRGILGYFADSETMKWSANHLKEFLVDLVEETSAERLHAGEPARIHLIAHSMGSHALVRALLLVGDDLAKRPQRPIFCDVVLAAPDIDRDIFQDLMVLELVRSRLAEHYTLYASSADAVLRTSAALQVYPRIGQADEGLVAVDHPDFDTIDASAVRSGWLELNHDYFVTEPRVIRDLIQLLRLGNRDPSGYGRLMRRRGDGPGEPWVLLPDGEPRERTAAAD